MRSDCFAASWFQPEVIECTNDGLASERARACNLKAWSASRRPSVLPGSSSIKCDVTLGSCSIGTSGILAARETLELRVSRSSARVVCAVGERQKTAQRSKYANDWQRSPRWVREDSNLNSPIAR